MESRVTVSLGSLSVEYEGPNEYLEEGLLNLIERLQQLAASIPQNPIADSKASSGRNRSTEAHASEKLNYSVNTIAAKLGGKNARDLALASAAYLVLVQQKENFSRQELHKTMQQATSYYKQTMGSNLTKTLARMTKDDELLENFKGTYSLSASSRERLEDVLSL